MTTPARRSLHPIALLAAGVLLAAGLLGCDGSGPQQSPAPPAFEATVTASDGGSQSRFEGTARAAESGPQAGAFVPLPDAAPVGTVIHLADPAFSDPAFDDTASETDTARAITLAVLEDGPLRPGTYSVGRVRIADLLEGRPLPEAIARYVRRTADSVAVSRAATGTLEIQRRTDGRLEGTLSFATDRALFLPTRAVADTSSAASLLRGIEPRSFAVEVTSDFRVERAEDPS